MSVIVTDTGFAADDFAGEFRPADTSAANNCDYAVDLPSDAAPGKLAHFTNAPMIPIDFLSFADGRGFTLPRLLRQAGYKGRLGGRAHVLADQYAMERRAAFDEIEISADLAARQPETQWLARADWQNHNYQARLRG